MISTFSLSLGVRFREQMAIEAIDGTYNNNAFLAIKGLSKIKSQVRVWS